MPARKITPRRRTRPGKFHPHRYWPLVEGLESRRLLASYTVNSAVDMGDADLDDGKAETKDGQVTLYAISMQAKHDNETQLNIGFTAGLNIPSYSGSFSAFSVTMSGTGITIGSSFVCGPGSRVTGMTFTQGLAVGNGSFVTDCKGGSLGLASNTEARNCAFTTGIGGRDGNLVLNCTVGPGAAYLSLGDNNSVLNAKIGGGLNLGSGNGVSNGTIAQGIDLANGSDNTITGCTIGGLTRGGNGDRNAIEDNLFENGGALSLQADTDDPTTNNRVIGNTFRGGNGIRLGAVQDSLVQDNVILDSDLYSLTIENDVYPAFHLDGRNTILGNRIGIDEAGQVHGSVVNGLQIIGSSYDTVGGVNAGEGNTIVGSRSAGISITSGKGYVIRGNYVGTDATGATGMGNGSSGITIGGDGGNTIGGTAAGAGNTVAGNGTRGSGKGISVGGDENLVQGNRVGRTRPADVAALANLGTGIELFGNDNTVGGTAGGAGNTVGGNGSVTSAATGILAFGDRNLFQGNIIGTDSKEGKVDLGNTGVGLFMRGSSNTVGGSIEAAGNVIAHNLGAGVSMAVTSQKNSIRHNSIHSNKGRGIRLSDMKSAINDPGSYYSVPIFGRQLTRLPDLDEEGGNGLPNYPVIQKFEAGGVAHGTLQSAPNKAYILEFYSNDKPHGSGFGDGQTFVTSITVQTDGFGYVAFDVTLAGVGPTDFISATATDPDGNTSGFSIVDRDLDGLADAWETDGIDIDEDGKVDLELKGASPLRKTIFIEVDRMAGIEAWQNGRAREGFKSSLDLVKDAFARAPVENVVGPDGIDLIIDVDEGGLTAETWHSPDEKSLPSEFDPFKQAHFGTPAERGTKAIDAKRLAYRYAVLATGLLANGKPIGGIAESPGNDFVVVTPSDPSIPFRALIQAGTFMHELGHTLGLRHGGGGSDDFGAGDEVQFKPNYLSVMNYVWQFPMAIGGNFGSALGITTANTPQILKQLYQGEPTGIPAVEEFRRFVDSWELDYSRKTLNTLFEPALDETSGIGGDPSKTVVIAPTFYVPVLPRSSQRPQFVPMGGPVDWDGSGQAGDNHLPVARNINDLAGDHGSGGLATETLLGHEDWSMLRYNFLDTFQGVEDGAHYAIEANEPPPFDVKDLTSGVARPDLSISAPAVPSSGTVDQNLTYNFAVRNDGPDAASGVVASVRLPAGVTYVSAGTSQGTATMNNGVVTFSIGGLAASSTATLTLVIVPSTTGTIGLEAAVDTAPGELDLADNTVRVDVTVNPRSPDANVPGGGAENPPPPVTTSNVNVTTVRSGKKSEKAIVLRFSDVLNETAAKNLALYRLFAGRRVKKAVKYDRAIRIRSATYDPIARTVTLRTKTALNLAQAVQLRVNAAGLLDTTGRPLDGDSDGRSGGDLVATLSKRLVTILRLGT